MTNTKFKFKNEENIDIKKGTILKRGDDMFIVSAIYTEQESSTGDVIKEAIFNNQMFPYEKYCTYKYVLISLSTGVSYFKEPISFKSLKRRIENEKFQYVKNVTIVEL